MRELAARYLVGRNTSEGRRSRTLLGPLAIVALAGALAASCSSNSSSSTTTSRSSTSTTSAARSTAAVSGMQMALASVGCYSGAVDGISGPATTHALRAFQAASGLTVDGAYGLQTKSKLLAAVSAGKRVCTTTTTTTTTSTTTGGSGVPSAAIAAITSYENANGPPAGTWVISSSQASTVDPTYLLFHIGPSPGNENTVQGGYGFAHNAGGTWSVIGFGSAEVGCPPGSAQNVVVPTAVLSGFGLSCPPS
jgi:peptidoglycan hydrolase-like protein with peptidoglycan-binding domain